MNILVTGGSSGLGKAIVHALAAQPGNNVTFTYCNNRESALSMTTQLSGVRAVKCDFFNSKQVDELLQSFDWNSLDVLINNAFGGPFLDRYFHKTSEDEFSRTFACNVIPTIRITQQAITAFRKRKQGRIITVLTAALTNRPPMGSSLYVAAKAYLAELSKCWSVENASFKISVNTVSPSFMTTHFTSGIDERLQEEMRSKHSLKEFLSCEEAAQTVLFLTQAGPHLNGVDILLNGGADLK